MEPKSMIPNKHNAIKWSRYTWKTDITVPREINMGHVSHIQNGTCESHTIGDMKVSEKRGVRTGVIEGGTLEMLWSAESCSEWGWA